MSSFWSADSRFKRTEIVRFPADSRTKTEDALYWKHQFPVTVQEFGPVSKVDICRTNPHYIAITGSTRVQVFNPLTNQAHKTLTKFRGAAYGAKFRRDGRLLCVGGQDGDVKVFDVASKTLLRLLKPPSQPGQQSDGPNLLLSMAQRSGHQSSGGSSKNPGVATKCCEFTADLRHVAGFSDRRSVTVWDISTEAAVASWPDQHRDYVRAGCTSETCSEMLVSGSYDHTVKVWDTRRRSGSGCTATFDHGAPVETVMLLPNGTLLVSGGGNELKVWDLLAGKLLTTLAPHNKTVTCLALATDNTKLVSGSLDRQIKFHDVASFKTVHSISFPSPVLTVAVAPDDSMVCAGMSDGLAQFLHRKLPNSPEDDEEGLLQQPPGIAGRRKKRGGALQHRYIQFAHCEPLPGDVVVNQDKKLKESRHDHFLRKFEYTKALDQVLKPYVQNKYPEYTYSVLRELRRRNGLKTAIGGRDEKSLSLLLRFLAKYVNDPRFSLLLMDVVDLTLDLYGDALGTNPTTDRLFVDIRKKMERESRNVRTLMTLQGAIDLILTASNVAEKPELRSEEVAFREHYLAISKGQPGLGSDLAGGSLGTLANEVGIGGPSETVLSWEKTLLVHHA